VIRDFAAESNSAGMKPLFTMGHSSLEFPQFVRRLQDSSVELLIDVRSRPHSSRFPQFSQPDFEKMLGDEGFSYLYLGEELGGRPDDPDAYRSDGRVDYRKRRRSYAFRAGVERILAEIERRTCALMCAEEDPLECHRFLMICPELVLMGIQPFHIRKGSKLEDQVAAENRLLELNGFGDVATCTLFPQARAEALEEAYELQAGKFAYRVHAPTV